MSRASRPRWVRWGRRAMILAVGLAAVFAAGGVVLRWALQSELQTVLDRITAADPRWTLADLEADRATVPDDRNAALHIIAYLKQYCTIRSVTAKDEELFTDLASVSRLNADQRAALAAAFAGADARREAARRLADFPRGRFPSTLAANPYATILNYQQQTRGVAWFLRFDLLDLVDRGDRDEAVRAWRALWNCNRALGDEPHVITMLIRWAVRNIAYQTLERMLAQAEWPDAALAAIQAELAADRDIDLFLTATRAERATADAVLTYLIDHPKEFLTVVAMAQGTLRDGEGVERALAFVPGHLSGQRAALLRHCDDAVAVARLPEAETMAAAADHDRQRKELSLVPRSFAPYTLAWAKSSHRDRARLRSAMTAVACERFRRRTGRFPDALDELVTAKLLDAVPADPYTAGPLKLARRRGTLVVYAVGPDGVDDGGRVGPGGWRDTAADVGFTLWPPHLRCQPPMPGPPAVAEEP